jgi:hypothetical protein
MVITVLLFSVGRAGLTRPPLGSNLGQSASFSGEAMHNRQIPLILLVISTLLVAPATASANGSGMLSVFDETSVALLGLTAGGLLAVALIASALEDPPPPSRPVVRGPRRTPPDEERDWSGPLPGAEEWDSRATPPGLRLSPTPDGLGVSLSGQV